MSDIAKTYRSAAMLSEEPSEEWIIKGVRGVKTFIYMAIRAISDKNFEQKNISVQKASELLSFLQGISNSADGNILGQKLATIYTNIQIAVTQAHAINSIPGFRSAINEIDALEKSLILSFQK